MLHIHTVVDNVAVVVLSDLELEDVAALGWVLVEGGLDHDSKVLLAVVDLLRHETLLVVKGAASELATGNAVAHVLEHLEFNVAVAVRTELDVAVGGGLTLLDSRSCEDGRAQGGGKSDDLGVHFEWWLIVKGRMIW